MKTWTKHLLCLCVVLFALGLLLPKFSTDAVAAEVGEDIHWSFQEETGTLTICGSGEMTPYSYFVGYAPPWAELSDKITEVVVSEGITSVSSDAFGGLTNLIRVTLPSTLTSIKDGAFWYCDSLKSITIPRNVSELYNGAWNHCINLEEIRVDPQNPCYADRDGILYNKAMTELLRCPEAWKGTLSVPEGVQKLENRAFYQCHGVTEVRLPSSVRELDYEVFFDCTSLKRADFSAISCEFDISVFSGCSGLEWITLSKTYPYYKQDNQGALYNKNMTCLLYCPGGYTGDFVVPFGVKEIRYNAFAGCGALKTVTIPGSVGVIDQDAFADCTTLERVVIGKGVKTIGSYAFARCFALKRIEIPYTVTTIESGAFWYCTSLQNIVMHHGVKTIEDSAFEGCESLTFVTIPDSVTYMGESLFVGCTALTAVVLPSAIETPDGGMFRGCENLRDLYFRGPAPSAGGLEYYLDANRMTLHYVEGQEGWTAPSWHGFVTKTWSGNVAMDVVPSDYFYIPVRWAMDKGITNGVGNDLFKPEDSCTRGQIVTFLWRSAGCPEPVTTESPFTDLWADEYYYKAVLWAAEQGITKGVADGLFAPEETCTRGQIVTFLWRAKGKPIPTSNESVFKDVSEDAYFAQAVLWAAEQGITNGVEEGRFAPDEECTRGQIVTFLWRGAGKPAIDGDLSAYCPVIEEAMDVPVTSEATKEGLLCDVDGDAVQELILMYYEGDQTLCDVYTIRDGEILVLLKGEKIKYMSDGGDAYCGVAEMDGRLYFYTHGRSFAFVSREDGGYSTEQTGTWKLYALEKGELSQVSEVQYDFVEGYVGYEWVLFPETSVTINGEAVSVEEYERWLENLIRISMIDGDAGYIGDRAGYSLEELLQICKAV